MGNNNDSKKLARVTPLVATPTRDVHQIKDEIANLAKQGFNTVAPPAFLSETPEDSALCIKILQFDVDKDFYQPPGSYELAPHKGALSQIAAAVGIQWEYCRRQDDRSDPRYCEFEAAALVPDAATGQFRRQVSTYAADYREGSEQIASLSAKQTATKRRHIVALADTGARLRVVREATGIGTYKKNEAARPFAVVSLVHRPGSAGGASAAAVALGAGNAAAFLYGGASTSGPIGPSGANSAPPAIDDADFPEELTGGASPAEVWPSAKQFAALPRKEKLATLEDAVTVSGYDFAGTMAAAGKKGASLEDLSSGNLSRLYETIIEELAADASPESSEDGGEWQFDDDDIPF